MGLDVYAYLVEAAAKMQPLTRAKGDNMKLELNTLVDINLPELSAKGKVKGISAEMPVAGCVYIVEVVDSNGKLPNATYPYTHIVVPEIYLSIAKD